jgi:tetratricopeptide (TPR) repeat protein
MTERVPPRDPERLSRDPALAGLIERANGAYRSGIDEPAAFQRLSERLDPQRRPVKWQRVTLGAALSFAAAAVLVVKFSGEAPSPVAFGPEVSSGRRPAVSAEKARQDSARDALRGSEDLPEAPADAERGSAIESERAAARRAGDEAARDLDEEARHFEKAARDGAVREPRPELERGREARPPKAIRTPEPDGGSRAEKQVGSGGADRPSDSSGGAGPTARAIDSRVDCLDMARQGEPRAAEQCFGQRASGAGLSAEMALYEMARLRRDVLRDGAGALSALDDYRQRFPQGSLRHEVDITRVELLSDLGQGRQALRESEALLASATGRERAAELHMLRGNIFRRELSDWKTAADEYAQAETFGGTAGAEATRLRGVSLEALGDAKGALAAYRRYLDLGGAEKSRKAEVNRRIEALTAGLKPTAP